MGICIDVANRWLDNGSLDPVGVYSRCEILFAFKKRILKSNTRMLGQAGYATLWLKSSQYIFFALVLSLLTGGSALAIAYQISTQTVRQKPQTMRAGSNPAITARQ